MTLSDHLTSAAESFRQILDARYSCRGYLPQPVPEADIRTIIELAQRTASWCNSQPWQLVITRGEETEKFSQAMIAREAAGAERSPDFAWPEGYYGVYKDRRKTCGIQLYDAVGVVRGDRDGSSKQAMENFRLFGAPHVAIVTSDAALGTYGAVDCGAFVSNFMLAAKAMGVASIAQAAIAGHAGFVREYFGIDDSRKMVCAISFGYEDPDHAANSFRTERASVDQVVDFVG
ncbi:MAG: nitroreductase [Novosphingobium sp.]